MKKARFFIIIATFSLLLSACSQTVPITEDQNLIQTKTQEQPTSQQNFQLTVSPSEQITQESASQKLTYADYKQWMLSPEVIQDNIGDWTMAKNNLKGPDSEDCYSISGESNMGGDLLSTLIADTDTRSQLALNVYTQDYVMQLENKVVAATHTQDHADFYATSVCHVGEGIDVLTGQLWPQGKKNDGTANNQTIWPLVIVNNNHVQIYKDIRTMGNTATGGESQVCGAKLKDSNLIWTCFLGLAGNETQGITGSQVQEWTIPLNGGKITNRQFVEYL